MFFCRDRLYVRRKCRKYLLSFLIMSVSVLMALTGCERQKPAVSLEKSSTAEPISSFFKDMPEQVAAGTKLIGNKSISVDISNVNMGYFFVDYLGDREKVKVQVLCPDGVTYTYNIHSGMNCLNIPSGDGDYELSLYESIGGTKYAQMFADTFSVKLENGLYPFLYPNIFVNFNEKSEAVRKAAELTAQYGSDIEKISSIYHYITENISYDRDKAEAVTSDYIPDIDAVLSVKKGICSDYASLMTAMLRSLKIPTKLIIGYAGEAYHAWISTYTADYGWIDGIIRFNGEEWILMDPTFGANTDKNELKKFIGDGSKYQAIYTY